MVNFSVFKIEVLKRYIDVMFQIQFFIKTSKHLKKVFKKQHP